MDKENNQIQVTLVRPQEAQEDVLELNLKHIFTGFKKYFLLWFVLAVFLGITAFAANQVYKKLSQDDASSVVSALVEYNVKGNVVVDISDVQSAAIVEKAMTHLGVEIAKLDQVRTNLVVTGVMSDDTYDQVQLYYNLLSKTSANVGTVDTLLDANSGFNRYIVSLSYEKAGLSKERGIELLNEIIACYRQYFNQKYNDNQLFGNSLQMTQYSEYDYLESISSISAQLESLNLFVSESSDIRFRSGKTGFTRSDLGGVISNLSTRILAPLSASISMNAMTKFDTSTAITYYENLILRLEREKTSLQSTLEYISKSIADYQRAPIVRSDSTIVISENVGTVQYADNKDSYDDLIAQKIKVHNQIVEYNSTIAQYEKLVERLKTNGKASEEKVLETEEALGQLYNETGTIIALANETLQEYTDIAVQSNYFSILVPAVTQTSSAKESGSMMNNPVVLSEVILIVLYILVIFGYAFKMSAKKEQA